MYHMQLRVYISTLHVHPGVTPVLCMYTLGWVTILFHSSIVYNGSKDMQQFIQEANMTVLQNKKKVCSFLASEMAALMMGRVE